MLFETVSGRTPVKSTESKFSAVGRQKQVKKKMERNFTHHWCKVPKCRGGTLQSAGSRSGTFELCTTGAYSFSLEFFTRFGRLMAENSDSVLSTGVRLFPYLGTSDQWCDQCWVKAIADAVIVYKTFFS